LPKLHCVTFLPDTTEVDRGDVIFSVHALDNNSQSVQIWVRTRVDRAFAEATLEKRLFEALAQVQEKEPPAPYKPETIESEPTLARVSSDTIAIVSPDPAAIMATTLGG